MKNQNRFFNAATNGDTITFDMFDFIGADYYGGGITEQMVSNALKETNASSVTLNINSPGGDAFSGVAIRNVLAQSGKTVNVNVVGLAASAASIIAMAGDSIVMHSGSVMMIHPAQSIAMGSADDMRKMADTLDTVTDSIADIYVARTGVKKSKVLDLMQAETWMTSQEAVDSGFATSVNAEKAAVKNSFDLKFYNNVPADLAKPDEADAAEAEIAPETPVAVEVIAEAEPDRLSLFARQLEVNRRK